MQVTKTILAAAIGLGISAGAFAQSAPTFSGSVSATTNGSAYSYSGVNNVNGTSAHTAASLGQNVSGISGFTASSVTQLDGAVVQGTAEWDPLGATKLGPTYRYTLTGDLTTVHLDTTAVSFGRTQTETTGVGTGWAVAGAEQSGTGTITGTIDAGAPAVGDPEDEDYIPARPATQATSLASVGSGSLAITKDGGLDVLSGTNAAAFNYSSLDAQTFTGLQALEHQDGAGNWHILQGSGGNPANPVAGAVVGAVEGSSISATFANAYGVTDPVAEFSTIPANIIPGGNATAAALANGEFSAHVQVSIDSLPTAESPSLVLVSEEE